MSKAARWPQLIRADLNEWLVAIGVGEVYGCAYSTHSLRPQQWATGMSGSSDGICTQWAAPLAPLLLSLWLSYTGHFRNCLALGTCVGLCDLSAAVDAVVPRRASAASLVTIDGSGTHITCTTCVTGILPADVVCSHVRSRVSQAAVSDRRTQLSSALGHDGSELHTSGSTSLPRRRAISHISLLFDSARSLSRPTTSPLRYSQRTGHSRCSLLCALRLSWHSASVSCWPCSLPRCPVPPASPRLLRDSTMLLIPLVLRLARPVRAFDGCTSSASH